MQNMNWAFELYPQIWWSWTRWMPQVWKGNRRKPKFRNLYSYLLVARDYYRYCAGQTARDYRDAMHVRRMEV